MSQQPLQVGVTKDPRGVVVALIGQGTLGAVGHLGDQLDEVLKDHPDRIVLDLSQLQGVSSLVIGSLITFRGRVRKYGGIVRMAAPAELVRRAFEASNLDWLLPIFDTVDAALQA